MVGGMGRDIRENWRVVEGLRSDSGYRRLRDGTDYRKVGGTGDNVGNRDYG